MFHNASNVNIVIDNINTVKIILRLRLLIHCEYWDSIDLGTPEIWGFGESYNYYLGIP